jgi:hypothetical protein
VESRRNKPARTYGRKPAAASAEKPTRASDKRPPRAMTEDEADILYCEKHKHEPGIPLRQALRELGIDESEVGL